MAGHLIVAAEQRDAYATECAEAVRLARVAAGCLDFVIGADLLDPTRINVFERWSSRAELDAFRGSGPSEEQQTQILAADVREFELPDPVRGVTAGQDGSGGRA